MYLARNKKEKIKHNCVIIKRELMKNTELFSFYL